jgi:PASTA domain
VGKRVLAVALTSCATLVGVGSAQANTLTIGSEFRGTINTAVLDGGAGTVVNTSLPTPLITSSPTDGTVVSWRFSGEATQWTPQVVRPLGGGLYTEAGAGASQTGTGVGNIAGPFPLNLPIKVGDLFGFAGGNFDEFGFILNPGAAHAYFIPRLQPGPGRAPDFTGVSDIEEAVSATVRYCLVPDLRGKKPKKAKQALKAADCTVGTKRKSKKRRKKKKVVGQSVPAGTSISDTAPVNFKVSRRAKRR